MKSVFVIIAETMPVNGTYPASSNETFWDSEQAAFDYLTKLFMLEGEPGGTLHLDDTCFYAEVDPEKFEYIEYRIEEHTIQTGE